MGASVEMIFVELVIQIVFCKIAGITLIFTGNYYDQSVTNCRNVGGTWTCSSDGECSGTYLISTFSY